jgi:hypothetical protein
MAKVVPLQRRGRPSESFLVRDQNPYEQVILLPESGPTVTWIQGQERRMEEFKTLAYAMRRMANILEGKVSFEDFATQPSQKPEVVKV